MSRKANKTVGTGFITEVDRYLFGQGTHYEIYEKLGAHPKTYKNQDGMYFAVWLPMLPRSALSEILTAGIRMQIPCLFWQIPVSGKFLFQV